jgi:hypothetical protein
MTETPHRPPEAAPATPPEKPAQPGEPGAGAAAPAGFGLPVAIALIMGSFFNAWSYWITAWAGNAAIAVG